jgi:hypothetical protein
MRVSGCAALLKEVRIGQAFLASILTNPDLHWHRRIVTGGRSSRKGKQRICFVASGELRWYQNRLWNLMRYILSVRNGHLLIAQEPCHLYRNIRTTQSSEGTDFPATAYNTGCNVIRNARWHRHNQSSWCLDISGAFASIRMKHLYRFLLRKQFPPDLAWIICRMFTYNGGLPQGGPYSPFIYNLLMQRFDETVAAAIGAPTKTVTFHRAKLEGFPYSGPIYTRYGDDLCFSHPDEEFPDALKGTIDRVIREHHLILNATKTREGRHGIMELPGVVIVHGRVRPPSAYVTRVCTAADQGNLTSIQRCGHRGYLLTFGRAGRLRCLRQRINLRSKPRYDQLPF